MKYTTKLIVITIIFAFSLISTSKVPAAVNLGIDFPAALDENNQITAAAVRAGASNTFQEYGTNPSVNTTGGVGSGVIAALSSGYMNFTRTNENYLGSVGANNTFSSYSGSSTSVGSGTVFLVIQPGALTSSVAGLFASTHQSNPGRTTFSLTNSTLSFVASATNSGGTVGTASLGSIAWESDSWYFVAASWSNGSAPTVYLRELKDGSGVIDPNDSGAFNVSSTISEDGTTPAFNKPVILGATTNSSAAAVNFFDGKIAYFQWTDAYSSTSAQYDALFDSLIPVPEPSSIGLALLGLGAVAAGWRARRKHASRTA